ncbi:putative acyl-activating enzyme 1, peroxisomal [Acorus calamus]|uniref:Acyl-activating enzyme 1, peroxisomal n=1 Tax=Acorus calamus TaxID=4465 RepID=A0AAV9D9P3_ACOCL|nr:putative acyl-activating enzyme 1, peroxisomal [Acorus calamus]
MEGTIRCPANYVPLTPISFLKRAASVYGDRTSIIDGPAKFTWSETYERCLRLATALTQMGVSKGDIVAVIAPNIHATYEMHFSVPMAQAVLCIINHYYDAQTLSDVLTNVAPKFLFVDHQFLRLTQEALQTVPNPPTLVHISDPDSAKSEPESEPARADYESLVRAADSYAEFEIKYPEDECEAISLTFTSGTTATPKPVVYSHRGAYLNAIASILVNEMIPRPTYLWTVPMFHCNGWTFCWAMPAVGGTNICQRSFSAKSIFDDITRHGVTHLGGPPSLLNMLARASEEDRKPLPHRVEMMTGGGPPPPQVVLELESMGFRVLHCYGCSETYGVATLNYWRPEEWDTLPPYERACLKARHGLKHPLMEEVDVKDPMTMRSVPADGVTVGEVMLRGNNVLLGYYKDRAKSERAFEGGWFRHGDLAVKHPDGYIEMKDRKVDAIVSGGEYLSTVDIEKVLYSHPDVFEAAVVGVKDEELGQVPCAVVKLKEGKVGDAEGIIGYCKERMPEKMVPRKLVFGEIPRVGSGKLQKKGFRDMSV